MKTSMRSCNDCDTIDKRTGGLTLKNSKAAYKVPTSAPIKKVKKSTKTVRGSTSK